jgi:carbonic anhydrase
MRLFEAIIDANHRAAAGDKEAGLHPADFAEELPVVALTCVDPRLNAYFPNALGLPGEQFIWLRNAGNIITQPMSSTMRSLALACAVKGGKEIAVIGHTDCQVCKTSTLQLLDRLKELGIERHLLPDNLSEFFGMFGSERQNVIKGAGIVRSSPLIGPKVPVHGLLLELDTGKLDWVVNGYEAWQAAPGQAETTKASSPISGVLGSLAGFNIGEMKFPEGKIGELATKAQDWLVQKAEKIEEALPGTPELKATVANEVIAYAEKHWPSPPAGRPPKIPPPLRPKIIPPRRPR